MRRYLSAYIAVALYVIGPTVGLAGSGKWELEQRRNFIFTLSYKQSASINNQTATSEVAFLCDQRNRLSIVGAILIPFDGTFESHQDPIPVSIQRKPYVIGPSDLLEKWKNGSGFLFLDVPNDVADLIALLKEKGAESDKAVHFYFPNTPDDSQQSSSHIVVDAAGFADRFMDFEKGCTLPQERDINSRLRQEAVGRPSSKVG